MSRASGKERRLEPQITLGLLTDATGFPLMVEAFEGNRAETTTMLPTIRAFLAAHQLPDVTVVADAGMISEQNRRAIEAAGLSFILGARISEIPYLVQQWRREHPDQQIPDGQIFIQPWPAGRPRQPALCSPVADLVKLDRVESRTGASVGSGTFRRSS